MTGPICIEMGRAMEAVNAPDLTIWQLEDIRNSFFHKESKQIIDDVLDKVFWQAGWWQANLVDEND